MSASNALTVQLAMLQASNWRQVAVHLRRTGKDGFSAIADEFERGAGIIEDLCALVRDEPKGARK